MKEKKQIKKDLEENTRPPIVVVMGHIDHGKTKILDYYRNTKIVDEEAGGITQHIGAYELEHGGKKITFIDTPGHEAFSKMRSRGARVADIAILVVAADEGVKPQTEEALSIIRENNIPFVIAINKIDKPEANPERIKKQLAEKNVLVESYGGKVPSVDVSAKTGQNMNEMLEVILLLAELEHLLEESGKNDGVVIEAHLDPRRGVTSTLLVRNGKIVKGDLIVIGKSLEVIKIFEDYIGKPIEAAEASSPIRMVGLSQMPSVGDVFAKFSDKKKAEEYIKNLPQDNEIKGTNSLSTPERPVFNIILKADVVGSKEALEEQFKKLESEAIGINILKSEVGGINESDAKLALATKLVTIVGFKVKMDAAARELSERGNIRVITGDIIYEILDDTKKVAEELIPPIINKLTVGKAKILKLFKKEGAKQVVGGRVEAGIIKKGAKVDIQRFKETLGTGVILNLQQSKQEASEVSRGQEFGILVESKIAVEEGDLIEIFEEEVIKRKL